MKSVVFILVIVVAVLFGNYILNAVRKGKPKAKVDIVKIFVWVVSGIAAE